MSKKNDYNCLNCEGTQYRLIQTVVHIASVDCDEGRLYGKEIESRTLGKIITCTGCGKKYTAKHFKDIELIK